MVPCWVLTGSVRRNFQNLRYFWCLVWKIEKLPKANLHENWSMQNSILEYFEYFCQMSSKSILIIFSDNVSKLTRFFLRHSVQRSTRQTSLSEQRAHGQLPRLSSSLWQRRQSSYCLPHRYLLCSHGDRNQSMVGGRSWSPDGNLRSGCHQQCLH